MKMYTGEKKPLKSWSIKLDDSEVMPLRVAVDMVDSETGVIIGSLIGFHETGKCFACTEAKDVLKRAGYDPYEHGNDFGKHGQIIIREVE